VPGVRSTSRYLFILRLLQALKPHTRICMLSHIIFNSTFLFFKRLLREILPILLYLSILINVYSTALCSLFDLLIKDRLICLFFFVSFGFIFVIQYLGVTAGNEPATV
jgi:hypothetical protein